MDRKKYPPRTKNVEQLKKQIERSEKPPKQKPCKPFGFVLHHPPFMAGSRQLFPARDTYKWFDTEAARDEAMEKKLRRLRSQFFKRRHTVEKCRRDC